MSYGPGWSVARPTRHSEKPRPSGRGGVKPCSYSSDEALAALSGVAMSG